MDTRLLDLQSDPQIAEASETIQRLAKRLRNVEVRRDELLGALATNKTTAAERAELLLDDPDRAIYFAHGEELERCQKEIDDIQRAIGMANQNLRDLRGKASYHLCQRIKPDYEKIVRRM